MKILDITLQNFRVFSDAKIEFATDPTRNVTIVLGNNGSGKTTIAQAFRWCLYNKINFNDPCVLSHKAFEQWRLVIQPKSMLLFGCYIKTKFLLFRIHEHFEN